MGFGKFHKRFFGESRGQTRVGEGRKKQRGEGPRISVLMGINNLEITSLFNKLSLGITLVV